MELIDFSPFKNKPNKNLLVDLYKVYRPTARHRLSDLKVKPKFTIEHGRGRCITPEITSSKPQYERAFT